MTIEEKAKAYDRALEIAKAWCKLDNYDLSNDDLKTLFPELKESEDERIRKELLEHCKNQAESYIQTGNKCPQIQSWITWLEKQGEQKFSTEVEPRFKVGDWLVHNERKHIIKVVNHIPFACEVVNILGYHHTITNTAIENNYHLWSIQDAKDGDVLTFKNDICGIIICKSPTDYDTGSYCRFVNDNFINKEESGWDSTLLVPTTKEQSTELFLKMYEAGYEWDEKKKKLKEIEKPTDVRTTGYWHVEDVEQKPTDEEMKRLLQTEYEKGRADAIAEMQKEWSEEDEMILSLIINNLKFIRDTISHDDKYVIDVGSFEGQIEWLKSPRPKNR